MASFACSPSPYSPTTTGKVERFHKPLRQAFFTPNDYRFESIEKAQEALDAWVHEYNTERPYQSNTSPWPAFVAIPKTQPTSRGLRPFLLSWRVQGTSRAGVDRSGVISLGAQRSRVGPTYVGESVEVVVQNGIVEILHGAVGRRSAWAPILVVHGDVDRIPIEGSLEWAASLQNSRLVRLPGVGHFPFLVAPDDLYPVLSRSCQKAETDCPSPVLSG